jgi:hypothetical protein
MTNYNFVYSYTRELIECSDTELNIYYAYDVNNVQRIDSTNNSVSLPQEIVAKIPDNKFLFYGGYASDPLSIKIMFETELNAEAITLLDTVVSNHKGNIPDKYGVWFQDSFVEDPENPDYALLFDTEELAETYITNNELNGAVPKGVVIL